MNASLVLLYPTSVLQFLWIHCVEFHSCYFLKLCALSYIWTRWPMQRAAPLSEHGVLNPLRAQLDMLLLRCRLWSPRGRGPYANVHEGALWTSSRALPLTTRCEDLLPMTDLCHPENSSEKSGLQWVLGRTLRIMVTMTRAAMVMHLSYYWFGSI